MTIGLDGLEKLNWGYVVITTPNGILDHEEAMRQNVGGQVLGFFHKELVFLVCVNGHQEATLFFFHICSSLYPVHHFNNSSSSIYAAVFILSITILPSSLSLYHFSREPTHNGEALPLGSSMIGEVPVVEGEESTSPSVHAYYSFGPLSAYLSINYLDRFLSAYELSVRTMPYEFVGIYMSNTCTNVSMQLIGNAKYVFEAKTIQRMELLVLSTLEWRMHFVTPFSFMDYFVHKFSNEFKPSEVAATTVALAVLGNANKLLIDNVLNHCAYMEKDKVMKCYEVIQDMWLVEMRSSLVSKAPQTPVGVLDVTCLSYTSAETTACLGSNSQSCATVKRRRLNNPSV
ncbi:hypothetical protein HPP92_028119 [Vanilla planifolia]|uniref:Cyclin C-terminal domain-containing protein n=1 Tax=Vanilla planifolia TaxID=51239 RepID=A0A835U4S9_VANPL|nr:hypothetical protein HPP92_028119 [Vanilla planifolia]